MEDVFKKKWINVTDEEKVFLYKYFKKKRGTKVCCENVIRELFIQEKKIIKPVIVSSNYKLKDGALLYLRSRNIHVTNSNLTDQLAEELLTDDRNRKFFEKIYEKVREDVEAKTFEVIHEKVSRASKKKYK